MKIRKRILKITGIVLASVLLLLVILVFLIRKPSVQTWLVEKTTSYLSDKLNTKVSIGSVNIEFFKTVSLENIYIEDKQKDTILYANKLNVSIGLFELIGQKFSADKIEISDATFNMFRGRDDADFNFQFILDALASSDTTQSTSEPPKINVKAIRLSNIRFHLRDEPAIDLAVLLPSAQIDLNKLDLKNPTLDIKNLILNQPDILVTSLLDTTSIRIDRSNDTAIIHLNTTSFQLLVDKFRINDAHFKFDDESELPDTTQFDTYHMDYAHLNLFIDNGKFVGDSIVGKIVKISCKEKSGLTVDSLTADAIVTPYLSELNNLYIRTPHSVLRDYFSFNYNRFPDFNYLLTKVIMKGDFKNSTVSVDDLAVFASALKGNHQSVDFTGRIYGTIDNLKGKQMDINAGTMTSFRGDVSFRGLPNVDETFIDLNVEEARSRYSDLKNLLPDVSLPTNINTLGTVSVSGNFSGFFKDFVAYGIFSTDIGQVRSDLNMKIGKNDKAEYSGSLSSSGFNLGKFLEQDSLLGKVSMVSKLKGSGMKADNFSSNILAHLDRFDFNGYPYSNISVDGFFDKKLFTGKLLMRDTSAKLDFQGTVNFNDTVPRFNFYTTIDSARLRNLNFSNENYLLSTELNIRMSGKSIDEMEGSAKATNTVFRKEKQIYRLDSLSVYASAPGVNKTFSIRSDLLSVMLKGRFDIDDVPQSFIALIGHYFPSLPLNHELPRNVQDVDYSISVRNAKPFLDFFFPMYNGISNTSVNGHFNSHEYSLTLNGRIPEFGQGSTLARDIIINGETDSKQLSLNLTSDYFQLNDSFKVLDPFFSVMLMDDTALINLKAHDVTDNYSLDIVSKVTGRQDFVSVRFLPSRLILNKNEWRFAPNNELVYEKKNLRFTNFKLLQKEQSVSISNLPGGENTTSLRLEMHNLHLEDYYNLFRINDLELKGVVDGNADMLNIFTEPRFDVHTVISHFHFNNDSISKIYADVNYNTAEDKMDAVVKVKDDAYDIEVSGNYIPQRNDALLNFKVEVIKAELPALDLYLHDYISNTEGKIAGQLFLKGSMKEPQLTGSMIIPYAKTTINYLQTTYSFSGEEIKFKSNLIDLGEFTIYDNDGNSAKAGGTVTHHYLKDFALNLYANTNNFQMLKTTSKDNSLFYGTAYAGGVIKFTGPIDNIDLSATLQSKKGTTVSIPITDDASVSEKSYIRFINTPGDTLKENKKTETPGNLNISLELDINPEAQVKIIFDQKAGDIINGNGSGHLRLEITPAGDFNLYGTYTIEQGEYLFTLQNFFNKKFTVEKGGTISWSGDPYEARVNLSAIYTVTKASLSDFIPVTGTNLTDDERRDAERKVPVNVYMNLTGSLLSPNIAFDIKIPESGTLNSYASRKIDELKQDENELNKQVFGLLMLNRFLPSTLDPGLVSSGVNTSLGEFVSNQLSYWLSQVQWFNKYGLDVNASWATYGSSPTSNTKDPNTPDVKRQELQVALTKRFFNERVSVDVGSNFDIGQGSSSEPGQTSSFYLGDFTVEYKLTPDGRVSLKGFYRSNYDIIDERNRNKYGGALSFKKEFNKLSEFFKRDKTKRRKQFHQNNK